MTNIRHILFILNVIGLDHFQKGSVIYNKHRGFCDRQYITGLYGCLIYIEIVAKVLNRESITTNVISCQNAVTLC